MDVPVVLELSPFCRRPVYRVPAGPLFLSELMQTLNSQSSDYTWTFDEGVLFVWPTDGALIDRTVSLEALGSATLPDVLTAVSEKLRPGKRFMERPRQSMSSNPFAAPEPDEVLDVPEFDKISTFKVVAAIEAKLHRKAHLILFQWGKDERMAPSWRIRYLK